MHGPGELLPVCAFSCSDEMYSLVMWSRLLVPKPGIPEDNLVERTWTPTALLSVYEPGPGLVAARFT